VHKLRGFAGGVAALLAVSMVTSGDSVAQATNTFSEVTVEYSSDFPADPVVSPDGTIAAFPLFGESTEVFDEFGNFFQRKPLIGVRVVDLRDSTRDEIVPLDSGSPRNESNAVAFSSSGDALHIDTGTDIVVFDLASFTVTNRLTPRISSNFVYFSSTLEHFYELDYVTFPPILRVVSVVTGASVFEAVVDRAEPEFSNDGQWLYVAVVDGLLVVPLGQATGKQTVSFQDNPLGVLGGVRKESSSGNLLALDTRNPRDFAETGFVILDVSTGDAIAEVPIEYDLNTYVEVFAFSPDDRFVLFGTTTNSETTNSSEQTLSILEIASGTLTPLDDPAIDFYTFLSSPYPVSTGETAWLWDSMLTVFDWDDRSVVEQRTIALPSNRPWGWSAIRHRPDTDELVIFSQELDDDFSGGGTADGAGTASRNATYFFQTISLTERSEFTIQGKAVGFDDSGNLAVSVNSTGSVVSVWDLLEQTRKASFRFPAESGGTDDSQTTVFLDESSDATVMVSPDGQTAYFIVTTTQYFYDQGNSSSSSVLWAMSTSTGEFSELATLPEGYVQARAYDPANNRILLVTLTNPDDWESPRILSEIDISSGQAKTLTSVEMQGVSRIVRVSESTALVVDYGDIVSLNLATGARGRGLSWPMGSSRWIQVSPNGEVGAAFTIDVRYDDAGSEQILGGTVSMEAIPGAEAFSNQLATPVLEVPPGNTVAGVFSADGDILYLVFDDGVKALSVPDGETIELAPHTLSLPGGQQPVLATLSPNGTTVWVGLGRAEMITGFYPVTLPAVIDTPTNQGGLDGLGLFDADWGWLIPWVVFLGSAGLVAGWLLRANSRTRSTEGGQS
jgi:hypothetical protein